MSNNDVDKLAEKHQKWYRTQNSFKVNKTNSVLIPLIGLALVGAAFAYAVVCDCSSLSQIMLT